MKSKWRVLSGLILLCATELMGQTHTAPAHDARITVGGPAVTGRDTLFLSLYTYGLANKKPDTMIQAIRKDDGFTFRLKIKQPYQYFSINQQFGRTGLPRYLLQNYLVEAGDQVTISFNEKKQATPGNSINYPYFIPVADINRYDLVFTGSGSFKYTCRYRMDNMLLHQASVGMRILDATGVFARDSHPDKAAASARQYLRSCKAKLTGSIYHQLLTDMVALLECERLYFYTFTPPGWQQAKDFRKNMAASYQDIKTGVETATSAESRLASPYYSYWQALYYKTFISGFPDKSIYNEKAVLPAVAAITRDFTGPLRDKIITSFLLANARIVQTPVIDSVLKLVNNSECIAALQHLMTPDGNVRAKDFQLKDAHDKLVSLRDFKGKVVLMDFWFIGCGACAKYYREVLKPVKQHFHHDTSVVFVTVNINTNTADWLKAIRSEEYTAEDCINLNTGNQGGLHSMITDYNVKSYPSPHLIDKKGCIVTSNSDELRFKGPERLIQLIETAKAR